MVSSAAKFYVTGEQYPSMTIWGSNSSSFCSTGIKTLPCKSISPTRITKSLLKPLFGDLIREYSLRMKMLNAIVRSTKRYQSCWRCLSGTPDRSRWWLHPTSQGTKLNGVSLHLFWSAVNATRLVQLVLSIRQAQDTVFSAQILERIVKTNLAQLAWPASDLLTLGAKNVRFLSKIAK